MKCFVIKNRGFAFGGWGNGYVVLPKEHPYYGTHYNNIPTEVHGGLTFSEYAINFPHFCGPSAPELKGSDWVIGFDTVRFEDGHFTEEDVKKEAEKLLREMLKVQKRNEKLLTKTRKAQKNMKNLFISVFIFMTSIPTACYQVGDTDDFNEAESDIRVVDTDTDVGCINTMAQFTVTVGDVILDVCCDVVLVDDFLHVTDSKTDDALTISLSTGESRISLYSDELPEEYRRDYYITLQIQDNNFWGSNESIKLRGYYDE